jgi:hypothetical protein
MPRPLSLVLLLLLLPATALAGGGLFLDAAAPIGVQQNRDRALFIVHDDGTLTLDMEITFSGQPADFAWVVPVPATPDLNVVPPSVLRLLDAATAPRIIPPPLDMFGDDGDDDDDDSAWNDDDDSAPALSEELEQVGPYEATLLSSDDPDELVDWLNTHGYLVTQEMQPYVAAYVDAGMKFVALKLAPEAGVVDIQPISMTWTGDQPFLPLVVAGVAAEPEMGIAVFVAGATTYGPTGFSSLLVDTDLLQADPRTGHSNYYPLLSWLADQDDGQAFFTEFSDASDQLGDRLDQVWMTSEDAWEARQYLDDVLDEQAWLTRLYTRISGPEMLEDPVFASMGGQAIVSGIHDLSGRPPVPEDLSVLPPVPCDDTYCGPGGSCATTDFPGVHGCVCDEGYLARPIVDPAGSTASTVTCQDASFDLLASVAELIADADPCADWDCGLGSCVVIGGMPACDCEGGVAGIPQAGRATCVVAQQLFGPDQLLWPGWPDDPSGAGGDDDDGDSNRFSQATAAELAQGCACGASVAGAPVGVSLLLLLLPAALLRRRP